jgi:hypothetical protein
VKRWFESLPGWNHPMSEVRATAQEVKAAADALLAGASATISTSAQPKPAAAASNTR